MSWDSVEVGLAGGEETVNFGARNETGSVLYQVDTLASVSPRGKVEELPNVNGAATQDGFCLVLSKQVLLFNPSCTVLQATLTFDCEVDAVAWSEDSFFMAIGERSGAFHFLHIATRQILFSENLITANGIAVDPAFLSIKFSTNTADETQGLALLSASGLLFQFSCLKLSDLHQAVECQDYSTVKQLREIMVMKCTSVEPVHMDSLAGLTTATNMGAPAFVTYGKECNLAIWGQDPFSCDSADTVLLDSVNSAILDGSGVLKSCTTCDGSLHVVLDEKNMLSLWDTESLTMVGYWSHVVVEDFLLVSSSGVQTANDRSEEEDKMVILTKPSDIESKRFLQVYTLPSMSQVYSLQVSNNCYIAYNPSNQETIYFIEAVIDRSDFDSETVALRIRCLTEALPENRLCRLLHKHQFAAAERFARQFNLDEELVFKVKANSLLDKVSLWNNDKEHDDFDIAELKDCFSKIKENDYIVNCCLQAVLPTVEDTYDILSYAGERASAKRLTGGKSDNRSPSKSLLREVLPVLDRLATFEMAYGIPYFSGPLWHSFRNADLLAEVMKCLERGEVCSAVIIWRRHQSQFEAGISVDKLESLLGSIRQELRSSLIVLWLRDDLVPFVMRVLPQGTDLLASWLEQRARHMELSEKNGWPKNALEVASVLQVHSLFVSGVAMETGKDVTAPSEKQAPRNGLARLAELVRHLRELLDLHTKYSCRISLSEFTQETTSTLVFRLLDGVKAAELISQAMTKYIGPYLTHHSLDKDRVLLDYVKNLYTKITGSYSYLSNSLWEARVIAVISCIKNKKAYCQATLEVMRHSVVPWSDAVERLVKDVMAAYPNNLYLKEQCRFVELKKVLRLYGVKSTNVPDAAKAKSIVRVILTRDEPTAMEDALKVVSAYSHLTESDAYVFRLQKLCHEDRASDCIELLKSLPSHNAGQYADEVITWLCGILSEDLYPELDSANEHITVACTVITLLKFTKKLDLPTYHDVEELLSHLTSISSLQKEFSEFLSLDKYQDIDERRELSHKYLRIYFETEEMPQHKTNKAKEEKEAKTAKITLTRLKRLCQLIGLSREELMYELATRALSCGDVHCTLDICRELLEHVTDSCAAHVLYKLAHGLCQQMAEGLVSDSNKNALDTDFTRQVHRLLQQTVTLCDPDLLCDCLELCKCSAIADEVYSQCETGEYGFSVQTITNSSKKDMLSEWTFGKRFKEDGLVLDSTLALPLAGKFSMASIPPAQMVEHHKLQFYQSRVAGRLASNLENSEDAEEVVPRPSRLIQVSASGLNIIRYLQENNLYKLALRYATETLGVCLQHYASNCYSLSKDGVLPPSIVAEKQHMSKISQMGLDITVELTGGLLVKVLNCKSVDHDLGLGYLCSTPHKLALEKLTSKTYFSGQNYAKIKAFAKVGEDYAQLINEPGILEHCQKVAQNATWGQRLSNMKIYIKDVYRVNREEVIRLLSELMQDRNISIEMILDFCRSFKVDENEALLMYVKMQLLPSCPPDDHDPSSPGADLEYEHKVVAVVKQISPQPLFQLLLDVGKKVDQYDYDRIMVILKLTKEYAPADAISAVDKGITLLEYLFHYERKAPPSKYEKTFSYSSKAADKDEIGLTSEKPLSLLSKKRLPFHPLLYGEPWKVISSELSEETVPNLIGFAKVLKLSSDQMYLVAIQNLFKLPPGTRSGSDSQESPLDMTISDIDSPESLKRFDFERARGLLFAVKNKEMATAAAKWIAQQLPLGEEKIKVLKACVDLAKDWKSSCSPEETEKANVTYNRLLELCRGVSTEHVLHKYDIAEPSLVSMVVQPAKLVCQLYEKYGARDPSASNHPPDIHKASNEVTAISNSNVDKIRLYLLEDCNVVEIPFPRYFHAKEEVQFLQYIIQKWLPASPGSTSTTMMNDAANHLSFSGDETSENDEDAMNLKRVIYLLQYTPLDDGVMFLLNYAYKQISSTNITSLCRLRALRALFAIAQDDAIAEVCKKPIDSIRQYMQSLVYLAELEALHIQQSLSAFQKCNKEGLVRGLWRNHNHEKRAVRLVAELCLENSIHDPQLWNSVLQQLLSFGMIKYLRRVLVRLAGVPDLWQVSCLPHIWRSVLLAPFKPVSPPLSEEELNSCQESAALLQRCPLLLDLDIAAIAAQFHRVGLQAHALSCLMLVPSSTVRQQHIKVLLDTKCVVEILDQLQQQREHAQTLLHADMVEREVFTYIETTNQHELLLGSAHFDKLVRHLITVNNIRGLLMKTLQAQRLQNAEQLVQLYHQVHPNTASGRFVAGSSELSSFEELWAFLETNKLLEAALPYLPQPEQDEENEEEGFETLDLEVYDYTAALT